MTEHDELDIITGTFPVFPGFPLKPPSTRPTGTLATTEPNLGPFSALIFESCRSRQGSYVPVPLEVPSPASPSASRRVVAPRRLLVPGAPGRANFRPILDASGQV